MYNRLLIIILNLLLASSSFATTITIKQDGSGDYISIQSAINNALNYDTLLVYPGTYFENINYNGKTLVIGSLFLTTQDPQHIGQTVINGNQNGSCVRVCSEEGSGTEINGITLTGGIGTLFNELSSYPQGGGIYVYNSNLIIKNCRIFNNTAYTGGGICASDNAQIEIQSSTIHHNYALDLGGGIVVCNNTLAEFHPENLNSIYMNYAGLGTDISVVEVDYELHIPLDTCTSDNQIGYNIICMDQYQNTMNLVSYSAEHVFMEQVNQDLYVSPEGDNNNSGLTPDEPLKNIYYAFLKIFTDTLNQNTIHLMPGTYSKTQNDDIYPLSCRDYTKLMGSDMNEVILDAEQSWFHIDSYYQNRAVTLKNISFINGNGNFITNGREGALKLLQNGTINIENIVIENCTGTFFVYKSYRAYQTDIRNMKIINCYGGAMKFGNNDYDQVKLYIENLIVNNTNPDDLPETGTGGGIYVSGHLIKPESMNATLINCEITENTNNETDWAPYSSALWVKNHANATLVNATISGNSSMSGGAVGVSTDSELTIYNSIIYDNALAEIYLENEDGSSTVNIYNSNIEGGLWGIDSYGSNTINYDESNVDADPLFKNYGAFPYALSEGSPCIDAGTTNIPGIDIPEFDLAGNPRIMDGQIDMGAYEFPVDIKVENRPESEFEYTLAPNPTSKFTLITIENNKAGKSKLMIFNSNGQLVKVAFEKFLNEGIHSETIELKDFNNKKLKAGHYHFVLQIDSSLVSKKLIVVK
ncbi:MAG: T9SS type A sorting domain-containing protein [Bacteroidales bacterium]|nr:T9SS type A sorting domain-containing protein [Bacteroidales bacterium]